MNQKHLLRFIKSKMKRTPDVRPSLPLTRTSFSPRDRML
jgi:hypothetical protein